MKPKSRISTLSISEQAMAHCTASVEVRPGQSAQTNDGHTIKGRVLFWRMNGLRATGRTVRAALRLAA